MRISDWSSDVCSSDLRFRPSLGNRNIFVRIAGNSGEAPRFPVVACSHDSVLAGRNEVPPHMTWGGKGITPAQHDPRAINAPERGTQAGTPHIKRHRSEARRVGKECVSTGRSRGSPYP